MVKLRNEHKVQDAMTFKDTMVLLASMLTGQVRSIFCQLNARRVWPFLPASVAESLPNAFDIPGPMTGGVVVNVSIDPEQSALNFLKQIQEDQMMASKHDHAPFYEICKKLAPEDVEAVLDNAHRNLFDCQCLLLTKLVRRSTPSV